MRKFQVYTVLGVGIRQMRVADVAAVAAIEADSPSSWSREQIEAELGKETGCALVAVSSSGRVEAWCCGLQAGPDAELLKVTVRAERRRKGLAEALLQALCSHFAEHDAEQVFLEVRSRNFPALQLYAKLGWQETGRRKRYYNEPADDAIILVRRLAKDKK
ncbi:MAG: ribosomal protein S18-alanine N-acetyltransferase [Desulfocapsa sp.]|nr:ribosomal protein S18-alanine N-acetyltransferase [Desulfocapsa sp.]